MSITKYIENNLEAQLELTMLSCGKFIRQSLELHLFFARIMKEHSFFLQIGFTSRDKNFIAIADGFRMQFDILLAETIALSNGVVSNKVLQSGEVFTPFTKKRRSYNIFYRSKNSNESY